MGRTLVGRMAVLVVRTAHLSQRRLTTDEAGAGIDSWSPVVVGPSSPEQEEKGEPIKARPSLAGRLASILLIAGMAALIANR